MATQQVAKQLTVAQKVTKMKNVINSEEMIARARSIVGTKEAGTFLASCLDLYSANLTGCDPYAVMAQCMKAASLHLPVSNALGFVYVVPYKDKSGNPVPTFMIGYKGLIQLAQRTGQYKYINADMIYEGEQVTYNRITGMMEIAGEAQSDQVIGYFAYFQLLNGFEKCVYWTKEKVIAHAKRYSKAYNSGPWQTNFDAMAMKTVVRQLISKYGIMSIEFANAIVQDNADEVEAEVRENANGEPLMLPETIMGGADAPEARLDEQAPQDGEPDF